MVSVVAPPVPSVRLAALGMAAVAPLALTTNAAPLLSDDATVAGQSARHGQRTGTHGGRGVISVRAAQRQRARAELG